MKKKSYGGHLSRWLTKCLILLGMTIIHVHAWAETSPNGKEYTVASDGIYYVSISDGTALQVVDADWIENLDIPSSVNELPVTEVAVDAFKDRIDIESVTFHLGMKRIGNYSFKNCSALLTVNISEATGLVIGRCAFQDSPVTGELVFPQDVTLETDCFWNTAITGVKIPGVSITPQGSVFYGCKSLKRAELGSATKVAGYMFYECTSLEYVKLPDGCVTIEANAFYNCGELKRVENTGSLKTIMERAFDRCAKLTDFELPDCLETIGNQAFNGAAFTTIRIPSQLKTTGTTYKCSLGDALGDLNSLESIYFVSDYDILGKAPKLHMTSHEGGIDVYIGDALWTELVLPASSTNITSGAYANIGSLKKVTIVDNPKVVTIESSAFENCANLESVTVGAGSIEFGTSAFQNCTGLSSFVISPKNKCSAFPNRMFSGCTSLQELDFANVVTLWNDAFYGSGIVRVDAPNIQEIREDCFNDCKQLVYVNLPSLTAMGKTSFNYSDMDGKRVFYGCEKLEVLKVPALTHIDEAFFGCVALREVDFSSVATLGNDFSLGDCVSLKELSMPKLIKLNISTYRMPCNLERADFPSLETMESAFENFEKLESINIPLIRKVPNSCFRGCKALQDINFVNFTEIGNNAFAGCVAIKNVQFGPLTKLGYSAFEGCVSIEQLTIPETVTDLNCPFRGCSGLKKLEIMGDVVFNAETMTGSFSPENSELIFNGNVTLFCGKYADCTSNLKKLVFRKDVGLIPTGTFKSDKLTSVTFNGTVGGFDPQAFTCPNLEEIKIADIENWLTTKCGTDGSPASKVNGKVTYIKTSSDGFEGFDKPIEELTVENGIGIRQDAFLKSTIRKVTILPSENESVIGKGAFYYSNLEEINIGEGITGIGISAFEGSQLKSIVLPETINSIGEYAFQGNLSLESITLSPNVKNLPFAFLANCPSLKYLNIPEGIETIGFGLFSKYDNLKFVSFPSTLKSLSTHNQYGTLHRLKTDVVIYSYAKSAPEAIKEDLTNVTVHVPAVALSAYKQNVQWSKANLIGDLDVDHNATTTGTTLTISVPVLDVDADNKVERYEVLCYPLDETGNRLDPEKFVFDANGNPITEEAAPQNLRSMEAASTAQGVLTVSGLKENTAYEYEVKGYTGNQSLVYTASGSTTTTNKPTSVDEIGVDVNSGEVIFYDLNGNMLDCGFESLASGIYICKTPKGTFKVQK